MTYTELATDIGVSSPTIKRWMTRDEIPFDKLVNILSVLELRFTDIDEAISFSNSPPRPQPTEKDEAYIAKHPREAYVLLLISLGYSFKNIQESLKVSKIELEKIFLALDRNKLIEYSSADQFRSLIRPPLKWSENGPFRKTYLTSLLQNIFHEALANHELKRSSELSPFVLRFGEVYMSRDLEMKFRLAIDECPNPASGNGKSREARA